MSRSEKMDSVLRNYFAGGRIRKTETNVFEIRQDLVSAPQEGAGGMRGGGANYIKVLQNKGF